MKVKPVNILIDKKFSKLENSRISLIESLKNIEPVKLETSPAIGKWSVAQIFYHLNRAERFSTIYVSKKRLDINNLERTGFKEHHVYLHAGRWHGSETER